MALKKALSFESLKFISDKYLRLLPHFLTPEEKLLFEEFVRKKEKLGSTNTEKDVLSYFLFFASLDEKGNTTFLKADRKISPWWPLEKNKKIIQAYKKIIENAFRHISEMHPKFKPHSPFMIEINLYRMIIKPTQKHYHSPQWHQDSIHTLRRHANYSIVYQLTENQEPHSWKGGELLYRLTKGEKDKNPIAKINGISNQAALVDNLKGHHMLTPMSKKHKYPVTRDILTFFFCSSPLQKN